MVPMEELRRWDPKSIYRQFDIGNLRNISGLDLIVDEPIGSNLILDFVTQSDIWKSEKALIEYVLSKIS